MRASRIAALPLLLALPARAQPTSPFVTIVPVITSGLTLPIGIVNADDDSGRLFIVEQSGKIKIYSGTSLLAAPFLDLGAAPGLDLISCCGERGLLGLAFDPAYETSGFFYVYYTRSDGDIVVARYSRSAGDANLADTGSAQQILRIDHPAGNHNGGSIAFGADGLLYLGTGDGGGTGDPDENGQDQNSLLGKILRIDPTSDGFPADGERFYSIPPSNPFVGGGALDDEIWAYGLRNPWRFGFDRLTGGLFIGDVGQGQWEEIDFEQPATSGGGINYGWDCREGAHDYTDPNGDMNADCGEVSSADPILEYGHVENSVFVGCSVTGGFPYRGSLSATIAGHYFFADYCTGRIFAGVPGGGGTWTRTDFSDTAYRITSFGEDEQGKLYFSHHGDQGPPASIQRIAPHSFSDAKPDESLWEDIETAYLAGVSLGCAGGAYCPDGGLQRQQAAALLVRARDPSEAEAPPTQCTPPYGDVSAGEYCAWIEVLKDRTITDGCGGGNFCPTDPLTRGALARFLLRSVDWPAATTLDTCSGSAPFADVPATHPLCDWIKTAENRGLLDACVGNTHFCPENPVRRDHLAAILKKVFSLPAQVP